MVTGVHRTSLTVQDMDRSIAFYTELFGFKLVSRENGTEPFYGELIGSPGAELDIALLEGPDGYTLELVVYKTPEGTPIDAKSTPNTGSGHFALLVDDLPKMYEQLKAKGVEMKSIGLPEVTFGPSKGGYGLYCVDPNGIVVELMQDP